MSVVCLPFNDVGGINSRYCLGQRSFKFFGPVNAFTPYHALMLAMFEELKVCTVQQGQQ
jgi:hypothetical protein